MLTIILITLIFILLIILNDDFWSLGDRIWQGFVAGLLGLCIGAVVSTVLGFFITTDINIKTEVKELYSLKDSVGVKGRSSGNIILTTGYVESQLYYFAYIKEPDGGFTTQKFNASFSTIYEYKDASRKPTAERNTYTYNWNWKRFHFPIKTNTPTPNIDYWTIYIPEGSITKEINLNLE